MTQLRSRPLRILLLEDSPQDAQLIEAVLEEGGLDFELTRASGQAGFKAALAGGRSDLILSDYNVPGFDGLTALAVAQRSCPDVPFLFVSGALGEERAIELLKRGATDYVLKDRLERLVPSVERALREAHEKAERKRAEAELRARAEFEQQLIGIVSHDLRNPLNAILLASSAVLKRDDLDARVTKSILRIQSSGERAARMIRDLLDFTQARMGGGMRVERKPVFLRELVQQVVEEAQVTHPGRELRTHYEGESGGEWDPDRLAQAVDNLVVNALRYSPHGTPVTVRTRDEGDVLTLEVHNEGEPISSELRARLFQPMQRGVAHRDGASRSVGLGLYIVDHIARAHGGEVDVHSSRAEGTTFRLRLPRHVGAGLESQGR
ncbi:hybrid sensor histidine kinase/response regulator [Hyalangium minutum]|uniref:histidine kinase n=1 Tax=Hyalangium minutum TaxID=394096 RepID=A0A085WUT8_9BACT|nr:HAMP domain-containing sensor histidine kinase [Hyalangium minutum]KFE71451.1 histidine protein kinase AsgD [Hyalangium minutum]